MSLLACLAAASDAMLVDMVDPESGIPCVAALRPIGPISALLITLSGHFANAPPFQRMSEAGARYLAEARCICGRERADLASAAACDCADVASGVTLTAGLPPDAGAAAMPRPSDNSWLLGVGREAKGPFPQLEEVHSPASTGMSALAKRSRKNLAKFMAAQASEAAAKAVEREREKERAATSAGLADALVTLLSYPDRPGPDALALPCLFAKDETAANAIPRVVNEVHSVDDIEGMLGAAEAHDDTEEAASVVSRDDYVVRLLQLQVILRLHLLRLAAMSPYTVRGDRAGGRPKERPDGAGSAKDAAVVTTSAVDPTDTGALEKDVVTLLHRLGLEMDLHDHSATASSFVSQVLIPTFRDSISRVLVRVCSKLEMNDALPTSLRDMPFTSDAEEDSPSGGLRSSQGTSQPGTDDTGPEPASEPEPEEAAPAPKPRSLLGDQGALKALTSRQITLFSKPHKKPKRGSSSSRKPRGKKRSGAKPRIMVAETPAKELDKKAEGRQMVKRARRDRVVLESPAVKRAKKKQAELERLQEEAAAEHGLRRSPRFSLHGAEAKGRHRARTSRLFVGDPSDPDSDMHISPLRLSSPRRRSPRRHEAAAAAAAEEENRGVKRALAL